ncbi:MAG: 23S rRNA (uracil(1939)-C(5))-methyltransferase RlmD [Cytophagales bacterium]|nr:MAG: 23S rRNA (uracil(1939)-C(5))-methyltransferase RlmD [Cytophagales bacterium]
MARKKPLPMLENIQIEAVAADGKCMARHEGMVIFVDAKTSAPEDWVDIQLTKKKKNYAEGRIVRHRTYSPKRIAPTCEHFGICGGCKFQHLPYDLQLSFKQQEVEDNFKKIAKVPLPAPKNIIGSPKQYYYRNKLEFTFSSKRWLYQHEISQSETLDQNALGFHIPQRFDKILDVNQCHLQPEPSNQIRLAIKKWAIAEKIDFFNPTTQEGNLRNVIFKNNEKGEFMIFLISKEDISQALSRFVPTLMQEIPEVVSFYYAINPKRNDTYTDLTIQHIAGKSIIYTHMEELAFQMTPLSFFQTNAQQAQKLYEIAREMANLTGNEVVYDLYTGTGTIALFVAKKAKHVVGIEYVSAAIEDAKQNAQANAIQNTTFLAGDMKELLSNTLFDTYGKPDVIITDPPRAGMHPDVLQTIIASEVPRIVYVSCNPATQARDVAALASFYKLVAMQPVDMFPHTHHVENVICLERI